MTRSELRWPLAFALVVMAATTVPYLIGYARAGEEWVFTGFVFGVNDGNSYIAKMAEGTRGAWLFTFAYTSEPQRGAFVFPFFLLLGKLAAPDAGLHVQLVALFHLARIAGGAALILVMYRFIAEFVPGVSARRLALVLATLGGGLGWLLALAGKGDWLGSLPLDFYSPEAFTFLHLYGLPHLAASRACMLAGLLAYLGAVSHPLTPSPSQRVGWGMGPGLLFLLAGLIQPLSLVVAYPVIAAHVGLTVLDGWRAGDLRPAWRTARIAFVTIAIASPIVVYTALAFRLDPLLTQWTRQNTILSPHPLHFLAAYGLLLVPAALGLGHLRRTEGRDVHARLLLGWALVVPVLLYAPFNLQRRLSEGFFVPLAAMAVAGIWHAGRKFAPRLRAGLTAGVLGLALPTTAVLLIGGIVVSLAPGEPVFIPTAEARAFEFLSDHGHPGAVVLSAFETGNPLPAFTPLVAYLGHGPETLFYPEKEAAVREFFNAVTTDARRVEIINSGRVRYVFHGPHERALGGYNPTDSAFLKPLYAEDGYAVYEYIDG